MQSLFVVKNLSAIHEYCSCNTQIHGKGNSAKMHAIYLLVIYYLINKDVAYR
jgi:hypothetical protein